MILTVIYGDIEMRQDNRYLEAKDEESFLEMCRLAASEETGGQWTDEKIDAIEAVELAPRDAVRRLFEMYTEEQQKAAEGAQAALEARDTMHVQLWERVMTLEQKLAAAISRAADAEKTEAAFSRLQSEHSDLIERENALESKLAAVPRYVFWCLNERERGRDVFPSLSEWLGEFAEPEKYPPFNAEDGLIDSIMQRGYAVWIRRMRRVPFGVILRRAGRYGAKTVTVYGAGETLPIALERALSKAERSQVPA